MLLNIKPQQINAHKLIFNGQLRCFWVGWAAHNTAHSTLFSSCTDQNVIVSIAGRPVLRRWQNNMFRWMKIITKHKTHKKTWLFKAVRVFQFHNLLLSICFALNDSVFRCLLVLPLSIRYKTYLSLYDMHLSHGSYGAVSGEMSLCCHSPKYHIPK